MKESLWKLRNLSNGNPRQDRRFFGTVLIVAFSGTPKASRGN
jgi:hypothetical protein